VVTADHGELLGEHGIWGHGRMLSQEEVRVPLLVKFPARDGRRGRRAERAQLTDVLPTVLARLGLPAPEDVQGGVLPRVAHPVVAELHLPPKLGDRGSFRALFEGSWKYVDTTLGATMLYDVADDWIPIYDRTDLDGFYVAIGSSGNEPLYGQAFTELKAFNISGVPASAFPFASGAGVPTGAADLRPEKQREIEAGFDATLLGSRMNFDSREETRTLRKPAAEQEKTALPEPVIDSIEPERMQAGIAQEHFEARLCRGITLENGGDVFANPGNDLWHITLRQSPSVTTRCEARRTTRWSGSARRSPAEQR